MALKKKKGCGPQTGTRGCSQQCLALQGRQADGRNTPITGWLENCLMLLKIIFCFFPPTFNNLNT